MEAWNVPFLWQTSGIFRPFLIPWEEYFNQKHGAYMCFLRKSQKFVTFLGKMQEISALEASIGSFQQLLIKYSPFPHLDISWMTKDLAQIKMYTYFNIEDANWWNWGKSRVISIQVVHIPIFLQSFGIFLSRLL